MLAISLLLPETATTHLQQQRQFATSTTTATPETARSSQDRLVGDAFFVWLMLLESCAWPLLLWAADASRIGSTLRRSLGTGSSSSSSPLKPARNQSAAQALVHQIPMAQPPPASRHLFTSGGHLRAQAQPAQLLMSPHRSQPVDCCEDPLRANFALMPNKRRALQSQQALVKTQKSSSALKVSRAASGGSYLRRAAQRCVRRALERIATAQSRRRRRRSRKHASRPLFGTAGSSTNGSESISGRLPVLASSTGALACQMGGSDALARRAAAAAAAAASSPTSSLSTLIRKFNHDNYTSVCQLYSEQRRSQINKSTAATNEMSAKSTGKLHLSGANEMLIEGLGSDGQATATRQPPQQQHRSGSAGQDGGDILWRKGGLFYNFCPADSSEQRALDGASDSDAAHRINPMLVGGGCEAASASGSLSQVFGGPAPNEPKPQQHNGKKSASSASEPHNNTNQRLIIDLATAFDSSKSSKALASKKAAGEAKAAAAAAKAKSVATATKQTPAADVVRPSRCEDNGFVVVVEASSRSEEDATSSAREQCATRLSRDESNKSTTGQQQLPASSAAEDKQVAPPAAANNTSTQTTSGSTSKSASSALSLLASAVEFAAAANELGDCNSLDYASLKSFGDLMSVESAGSEFEYCDIGAASARRVAAAAAAASSSPPTSATAAASAAAKAQATSGFKEQPSQRQPQVGANVLAAKPADDLRFPSFMATPPKASLQSGQAAKSAAAGSDTPPLQRTTAGQKRPAAVAPSSSLLNLSGSSTKPIQNNVPQTKRSQAQLVGLALKLGGSSGTITKQRRTAQPAALQVDTSGSSAPDSSLPSERGQVRARIERMELAAAAVASSSSSSSSSSASSNSNSAPNYPSGSQSSAANSQSRRHTGASLIPRPSRHLVPKSALASASSSARR